MSSTRKLPVLNGRVAESSIYTDGTRKRIEPARVHGRFASARRVVFAALIAIWLALPSLPIRGRPALFLDVEHRRFFVFGGTFAPQDFWLVFFLATGVGFGLVFATALAGRVWCGWACPQTVFTEALFRPIERLAKHRQALKHGLFAVAAVFVAHVFIAYFVSLRALWSMTLHSPAAHPEAFVWMLVLSALFYGHFSFFREQVCVVLCPYGRLQSVLLDDASLVIAYDEKRGEPRGKKGKAEGDCVDCRRCVVVCPTGIDIRNGLQMDCVACTACIDACDDIMDKLGRSRGLIRYVHGKLVRPRIVLYAALLLLGTTVFFFAFRGRTEFEATLLRQPGIPFVRDDAGVHNTFIVHIANKSASRRTYELEVDETADRHYVLAEHVVQIEPLTDRRLPLVVTAKTGTSPSSSLVTLRVRSGAEVRVLESAFLGSP